MSLELPALGYPNRVDGIDVSAYQSRIDYAEVARAGFRFAVVKASEGIGHTDPLATAHLVGFRDAGLLAFPYAFLRPSQGHPADQVARLWASLGDVYPGRLALDLETRDASTSTGFLVSFAEAAVEECERYGLLPPALYTYPDYARHLQPELGASALGRCPLWMASIGGPQPWYPGPDASPYLPPPWQDWAIWQYGGDLGYLVPGVVGPCDRNLFNGTEADLHKWFGLPEIEVMR